MADKGLMIVMIKKIVWLAIFFSLILTACSSEQSNGVAKEAIPPLIQAIMDKDVTKVREIVSTQKEFINQKDGHGSTPLHTAIVYADGDMEIIKILSDSGADFSIKDDSGESAFFMAVDFCFVKAINFFLDKGGVNVNELDNEGNTPLMMLALRGGIPTDVFMGVTDRMVMEGADLTLKNKNGDTFYSNLKKVQYDATIKAVEQKYLLLSK